MVSLPSCTLIDDCYNANPVSMKAAIDLLTVALGRKVAILGDMFELGEKEKEMHGEVGAYAAEKGIDVLICVGELSGSMYENALNGKQTKAYYFKTRDEMLGNLKGILQRGDNILVKASHGMEFDKVVKFLTAC